MQVRVRLFLERGVSIRERRCCDRRAVDGGLVVGEVEWKWRKEEGRLTMVRAFAGAIGSLVMPSSTSKCAREFQARTCTLPRCSSSSSTSAGIRSPLPTLATGTYSADSRSSIARCSLARHSTFSTSHTQKTGGPSAVTLKHRETQIRHPSMPIHWTLIRPHSPKQSALCHPPTPAKSWLWRRKLNWSI